MTIEKKSSKCYHTQTRARLVSISNEKHVYEKKERTNYFLRGLVIIVAPTEAAAATEAPTASAATVSSAPKSTAASAAVSSPPKSTASTAS